MKPAPLFRHVFAVRIELTRSSAQALDYAIGLRMTLVVHRMILFRVATVALVSTINSLPTWADPIVVTSVVTSGNITTVSPSIASSTFTFSGDGLSLSGFLSEGGFLGCTPCPEG